MLLQSFRAQWFKNFRREVVLDDLGPHNVIHGANNVGKSNLLEAIGLFFVLLDEIATNAQGRPRRLLSQYPDEKSKPSTGIYKTMQVHTLEGRGYAAKDIFNRHEEAHPIHLAAEFGITVRELEIAGIILPFVTDRVSLALSLTQQGMLGIERFTLDDADAMDLLQSDPSVATAMQQLLAFLAWPPGETGRDTGSHLRYTLIQVDRGLLPRRMDVVQGDRLPNRELIPADLILSLYDAKASDEKAVSRLWRLFLASMDRFGELLGDGAFDVTYNRESSRASLVFHGSDESRIPAHLLGSGVQQVITLLGRVLMTRASILAMEEPELNLRYTEQLALREALDSLVAQEQGPRQVFLASHSPAFELSTHFYAMNATEDGPVVEKRPSSEALEYTQHDLASIPAKGSRAPLCYVSSEGLVMVPEDVRRHLGVTRGGGVRFIRNKRTNQYEILSTEQFLELLDNDDGTEKGATTPEGSGDASR